MKRLIITVLAASSLGAALPAIAVARHRGHHSRHASTRSHHRVSRVRHERFGQDPQQTVTPSGSGTTTTGSQPDTAGTVASFTGGMLTITLNDASGNPTSTTVSGTVTDATRIRCEGQGEDNASEVAHHDGDGGRGDSGGNDESGNGSSGSGDDNGDQNAQACVITPGETVAAAELSISSAGAVWQEVELVPQSTTSTTTTSTDSDD